jgi:hypothetical protein
MYVFQRQKYSWTIKLLIDLINNHTSKYIMFVLQYSIIFQPCISCFVCWVSDEMIWWYAWWTRRDRGGSVNFKVLYWHSSGLSEERINHWDNVLAEQNATDTTASSYRNPPIHNLTVCFTKILLILKMTVSWDVALCSLMKVDYCFWGAYLHHH